jgi:5-methylcytosine-specific restriction endonuclease McrA
VTPHSLRKPCVCGGTEGYLIEKGAQDCVYCGECDAWQYNAPRTETGKAVRSVTTIHNGIKPKQRARILMRASARCEVCGSRGDLHVGHIVSVEMGLHFGLPDDEINDDENLMALCSECNLGMGAEPMPLRLAITVLRARITWRKTQEGKAS